MADVSNKSQREAPSGRAGLRLWHGFFLVVLLIAPAIALVRLDAFGKPLLVVVTISTVSLVAFVSQWLDKRRAESDGWRVPEKILHLLELLGGWPGAFLAQRGFRHKTAKLSYQFVFWLIVLAYEYVAVDFLLGWKLALHLRQLLGH